MAYTKEQIDLMTPKEFRKGDKVIVLVDHASGSNLKKEDVVMVMMDGLDSDGDVIVRRTGANCDQYVKPHHIAFDLDYFKKVPVGEPDLRGYRKDDLGGLAEIGEPRECKPSVDAYDDQREEQAETGGGMRFNEGKPKLVYNDFGTEIAELEAAVWEVGARKYDTAQWLKGQSALEAYSSMKRHMLALLDPNRLNDLDDQPDPKGNPGSGLHHGGHLICAVKIFVHALIANEGKYDDRPKNKITLTEKDGKYEWNIPKAVALDNDDFMITDVTVPKERFEGMLDEIKSLQSQLRLTKAVNKSLHRSITNKEDEKADDDGC